MMSRDLMRQQPTKPMIPPLGACETWRADYG